MKMIVFVAAFFAFLLLIAGCASSIDYDRVVVGWKELGMQPTETRVTIEEASARCQMGLNHRCSTITGPMTFTSCYQWDFDTRQDWIWLGRESDLAHERAHRDGHPHKGEGAMSSMQCSLDLWRSNQERDQ